MRLAKASEIKVGCETLYIKDQNPAEGIVEAVNSKGSDLMILASHGRRGIKKALLGGVANEVITHSKVTVLVYR